MESDPASISAVIAVLDLPYSNEHSCFILRDQDKVVLDRFLLEERNRRAPRLARARANSMRVETSGAAQPPLPTNRMRAQQSCPPHHVMGVLSLGLLCSGFPAARHHGSAMLIRFQIPSP
jgi:hypothetical protein